MQEDPNERILDDRPSPDRVSPIALLYPPFGNFYDSLESARRPSTPGIYKAVDLLSQTLLVLDSDEQTRRDTVFNRVTTILRLKGSNIPSIDADGCLIAPSGAALAVVVFQNEITDISAHPHAQAVGHYSHLHCQRPRSCIGTNRHLQVAKSASTASSGSGEGSV